MIQDKHIMHSVANIIQRAERQLDSERVLASFVDVGLLPQIDNYNHQIIYGRRGTGKTHVLRVFEARIRNIGGNVVVYLDARILGSTSQFSDPSEPIKSRCTALFRDILLPIYHDLLEYIVYSESPNAEQVLESVDAFGKAISDPVSSLHLDNLSTTTSTSQKSGATIDANIGGGKPSGVGLGYQMDDSATKAIEKKYRAETEDKVIFPEVYSTLARTLDLAQARLYILLDEWSSIPIDLQPYLAEFLKRSILPVQRATVKIASLEYRSRFSLEVAEQIVGFELGADISVALDLDDYFVYDRNPGQLTDTYSDILFRHMQIELPEGYLETKYRIENGQQFQERMFTETRTFQELARASEGVVRDLINIFHHAFFDSHRRGRETIDRRSISEAARKWFEQDKLDHLDDAPHSALRSIINYVIGKRHARSFLVRRELERHPMIQKLFDARVIHHMQRGYADKDNPGIRYNIYTLDYGTYVDLILTSRAPQLELFEPQDQPDEEVVVPFDDKRSIRRIIVDASILDAFSLTAKTN